MKIIYVPCGSEEEAHKMAETLVEEKLIACANIISSKSVFRWEGRLEMQPESILIAKTDGKNLESAKKRIMELHSYDVPALLSWDAEVNDGYGSWMKDQFN